MRILLFIILLPLGSYGQSILHGRVIDGITKQPFDAANVFVSNSTYSTITNPKGDFYLQIPEGNFEIIVSHIGNLPMVVPSTMFSDLSKRYTIELTPEVEQLRPVTILAAKTRAKYLKLFKDAIIGTSKNGEQTEIVNLNDVNLELNEEGDILEVTSIEPLIIENKALNYRLTFILANFKLDIETGISSYAGYPLFADLTPITDKALNRVNENRLRAYNGSIMHFIRSLYNDKLHQEGFKIDAFQIKRNPKYAASATEMKVSDRKTSTLIHLQKKNATPEITVYTKYGVGTNEIVVSENGKKYLSFTDYLRVTYVNEDEEPIYVRRHGHLKLHRQTSQLKSNIPSIEIFGNGNYSATDKLVLHGYMGWEKLADLVPFDYNPSPTDE